jgi:hypothetical protein
MLLPVEPEPAEPLPVVELGLLEELPAPELELEPLGELVLPLLVAPFASSQRCFSRPVRVVQSEAELDGELALLEPVDGVLELDEPLEGELPEPLP